MDSRTWVRSLAVVCLLARGSNGVAADDTTLLRVFLTDGTSLISYGEPARVGDRVIFSMPTASTPNPPLHLVTLAADQVDWVRTDQYAAAAREAHYVSTQADLDYAVLSDRVTDALTRVTTSKDSAARLAIAQDARKMLATWPQAHYNYRAADVRQMLSLLDEAIADLQAAAGDGRFELSLSTVTVPPAAFAEPLLPSPTPKEAIEQVLAAARLANTPAERTQLLRTAVTALNRDAAVLPPDWFATTRASTTRLLGAEVSVDRAYRALARQTMAVATLRAKTADVRGIEELLDAVRRRDEQLGGQRPESVSALMMAVRTKLDAARRLALARDRWALRAEDFGAYRVAMKTALLRLVALRPSLERIKLLAGSTPSSLDLVQRGAAQILSQARRVTPPNELRPAHALLVSAAQLADNAARIRREATLAGDLARAWDASSAAAGALMLAARAQADIQAALRPPQLR